MIKQVLRQLDFSVFAEVSLVMFLAIFLIVSVRAILKDPYKSKQHATVVLDENEVKE